jgi:hypothetical protein
MLEPLCVDITALKDGWGYFVSFPNNWPDGDFNDFDGISPTLREALQKVLTLIDPKLRIVEDVQYDIDTSGWTPKE